MRMNITMSIIINYKNGKGRTAYHSGDMVCAYGF